MIIDIDDPNTLHKFYVPPTFEGQQNPGQYLTVDWDMYEYSGGACKFAYSGTNGITNIDWVASKEEGHLCRMNLKFRTADCGLACHPADRQIVMYSF